MLKKLLTLLADGELHSGESLGDALGLSRAAVWKQIQRMMELGFSVNSTKGQGYQLGAAINMLDADLIKENLDTGALSQLTALDLQWIIPSTNAYCLSLLAANSPASGYVCLAEQQSQGRGRRGRIWASPLAANIYLSVIWRFSGGVDALEGLSLAVGLAVVEALDRMCGLADVRLKWPNDILWRGCKLGGILIEMTGDTSGPCGVVIGLGLNVCMPSNFGQKIEQAWVDLAGAMNATPSRNVVVAALLNSLLPLLAEYETHGFAFYRERWARYDAYYDADVMVQQGEHAPACVGVAKGVTEQGALLVDVDGVQRSFKSGEVSLRRV